MSNRIWRNNSNAILNTGTNCTFPGNARQRSCNQPQSTEKNKILRGCPQKPSNSRYVTPALAVRCKCCEGARSVPKQSTSLGKEIASYLAMTRFASYKRLEVKCLLFAQRQEFSNTKDTKYTKVLRSSFVTFVYFVFKPFCRRSACPS